MNQTERFKILQSCEYLIKHLPSTQINEIHNIWMRLSYREEEELKLPDFKKCDTCNNVFPISYFSIKLHVQCESKTCINCREKELAIKGIRQSLRYSNVMEDQIQSFVNEIPEEIIELKILIKNAQKKLQNYDAS